MFCGRCDGMKGNHPIKIREILKRPYFRQAEVIASEAALERPVKWIHIMEVTNVGHLLNGDELILTTGIGWQNDEELGLTFLNQLVDSRAAGLCIEIGAYTKKPSERMIQLAQQANFPLILFHEEVKYVDITRDLHTFFIHHHHQMIASLDLLTNEFNQLLLSGKGLTPLFRLLHEKTKKTIVYIPYDGTAIITPNVSEQKFLAQIEHWKQLKTQLASNNKIKTFAFRPISLLNQTFADLMMIGTEELNEFDILALDRCTTAVAQELLRTMYIKEHRHFQDHLWVKNWLDGNLKESEVIENIALLGHKLIHTRLVVCVFEINHNTLRTPEFETNFIQRMIVARSLFKRLNITLIPTMSHHQLIFILANLEDRTSWMEPVKRVMVKLQKTDKINNTNYFTGLKGFGPVVDQLMQIGQSYELACETVDIQKTLGSLDSPFYTELHIYRLLSQIEKSTGLQTFISDYLGTLITYDKEKNSQLLKTLKVYLHHSCSKQETATHLYIVRQTLYHRLLKISELLGEDFTKSEKRLMLEFAIYAYEYVHGPIS